MKHPLVAAMSAAFSVLCISVPTFAATAYHYENANVIVNGQAVLSDAQKFVSNNTTYMSVYDVQLLVNHLLGTTNQNGDVWNGTKHSWNITDSKASPARISGSSGNTVFEINGASVINAPVIVTQPPGDPQPTSFVPIWYVQQIINELLGTNDSTSDVWNGSVSPATWAITPPATVKSTSQSWVDQNQQSGKSTTTPILFP